jgi:hypothetical protein
LADYGVGERILLKWILKETRYDVDWTDLVHDRPEAMLHLTRDAASHPGKEEISITPP